ncbi:hypothetical protein ABZ914_20005 [Spirillospora sp. NPDC046719]
MAADRHAHERRTAHDEWLRDLRKEAYVGLVDMAEKAGQFVEGDRPVWESDPPAPPPELPDLDEQRKIMARVIAFGTEVVLALAGEWEEAVKRALVAASAMPTAWSRLMSRVTRR